MSYLPLRGVTAFRAIASNKHIPTIVSNEILKDALNPILIPTQRKIKEREKDPLWLQVWTPMRQEPKCVVRRAATRQMRTRIHKYLKERGFSANGTSVSVTPGRPAMELRGTLQVIINGGFITLNEEIKSHQIRAAVNLAIQKLSIMRETTEKPVPAVDIRAEKK